MNVERKPRTGDIVRIAGSIELAKVVWYDLNKDRVYINIYIDRDMGEHGAGSCWRTYMVTMIKENNDGY